MDRLTIINSRRQKSICVFWWIAAKIRRVSAADCIGRIIVNPDLVPKIIQALQTAYDADVAHKKMIEGSKEE